MKSTSASLKLDSNVHSAHSIILSISARATFILWLLMSYQLSNLQILCLSSWIGDLLETYYCCYWLGALGLEWQLCLLQQHCLISSGKTNIAIFVIDQKH